MKSSIIFIFALLIAILIFSVFLFIQDRLALKELLLSASKLEESVSNLQTRMGSIQNAVDNLRNLVEEPYRLLKSKEFFTVSVGFDEVIVKSLFTFSEYKEGSDVFLVLNDEAGSTRTLELDREDGVSFIELSISPFGIYSRQILVREGSREIMSDRFQIPPENYRIQNFEISGRAWQQDQNDLLYSFHLITTSFIQNSQLKIAKASVRVMNQGEVIDVLDMPFQDGQTALTTTNYTAGRDSNYEFFADVTYGFGGSVSRKIEVKYNF